MGALHFFYWLQKERLKEGGKEGYLLLEKKWKPLEETMVPSSLLHYWVNSKLNHQGKELIINKIYYRQSSVEFFSSIKTIKDPFLPCIKAILHWVPWEIYLYPYLYFPLHLDLSVSPQLHLWGLPSTKLSK